MKKYLNIISINEYKIIGSYTDPNIKSEVISDIDGQDYEIFEKNNLETYKKIQDHFKDVFKKLKDNKRAVITDFKCGIDNTNTPYRWKYKDIQRGYLYDENGKVYFIDQLQKQSIIKIDLLVYNQTNKTFEEITMNYFFKIGNFATYTNKDKQEIGKELLKGMSDYRKEGLIYKSLKRLNSYYRLFKKKNKNLLKIINSEFGIKAREQTDLKNLLYAMEHKNKFNEDDIQEANTNNLTIKEIKQKIDELDKVVNGEELQQLVDKYGF